MTFLLDTTVLIDVLRGRKDRRSKLEMLLADGHTLATSVVNLAEVYAGMRVGEESRTEALLANLEVYVISTAIARRAGFEKGAFARRGVTLALADMMIAATAIEHGLVLMTDNQKDFPNEGLSVFDWDDAISALDR